MVIKLFFLKQKKNIVVEIRYYIENDNEKELLNYWKNLTNNDPIINYRTYVQPTVKPVGHNNSNKFGLVKVEIYDTYAKEKLNAYIDYVKEEWMKKFENEFNVKIDRDLKEVVKNK